jgi:hypothetical protein
MQNTNNTGGSESNIADDIYLSQLFIAKKIGNTTIKLGRQELPQSLSPFAYSEGWNVFKNTFDAAIFVNSDIPDTTVVGAYVAQGNGNGFGHDMSSFTDLQVNSHAITGNTPDAYATGTAYMLTVQNKSIPMTTVTASYYDVAQIDTTSTGTGNLDGANYLWGDVAVADKSLPMGLKVGVQGGKITTETSALDDTSAWGVKVGLAPIENLTLCVAYTTVDDGQVQVRNTGGVKTPLYTQLIANQGYIGIDNNTYMLKLLTIQVLMVQLFFKALQHQMSLLLAMMLLILN